MSEKKHTPLPWHALGFLVESTPDKNDESIVVRVATCDRYYGDMEASANTEFIVRACNAHDELVAALEDMMAAACGRDKSCGHHYECDCRYDKATIALAKATGRGVQ